ncbi:MAG TPA: hypothetical protein VMV43_00300 [Candidatus Nanopelagicaceae bacterium]|nr:hypothetical protein [Candidatus Nanopelagicaceae bacterium]
MAEGRVFWHYTCPICEKRFEYSMIAGAPIKICSDCKKDKTSEAQIKLLEAKLFSFSALNVQYPEKVVE